MLETAKIDEYLSILQGIHNKSSMRAIAKNIFKSLGWVQILCRDLEAQGFVENPYLKTSKRKYHGRYLTPKGKELLRKHNLLRER
jgi:DNA-binding MarR family transcriptional regulator